MNAFIVAYSQPSVGGSRAKDKGEVDKVRGRVALELHGKYARLNFPPEEPPLD